MLYLNLYLPQTVRSPEFVGCTPTDQATWLKLNSYCCEQENGGRIPDCEQWGDRRWMATCTVTKKEVRRPCPLWTWADGGINVWGYSLEKELEIQAKRKAGKKGGLVSASSTASSSPTTTASSTATSTASTEGKGREGKEIGREREAEGNDAATPTLQEVLTFADMQAIPKESAERFFNHHDGHRLWFNKFGQLVKWQTLLVSWAATDRQRAPVNHAATPELSPNVALMRDQEALKRVEAEIKHIRDGYSDNQDMNDEDRFRIRELKSQAVELKKKVGFAI